MTVIAPENWNAANLRERRLTAAAGDMLAALKGILASVEIDCGDPDCADCQAWRPARAAVAKAEG